MYVASVQTTWKDWKTKEKRLKKDQMNEAIARHSETNLDNYFAFRRSSQLHLHADDFKLSPM